MNALSKAEDKAKNLGRDDYLRMAPLEDNTGIVAYFASDQGLRSLGQLHLVQGNKPGYGLVIAADGSIPRDAEAGELLKQHNAKRRASAPLRSNPDNKP
jgi:hypothetical protein